MARPSTRRLVRREIGTWDSSTPTGGGKWKRAAQYSAISREVHGCWSATG